MNKTTTCEMGEFCLLLSAPEEEEDAGDVQKVPPLLCAGCRTGASFDHSNRSVSFACQQVNAGTKPLQRLQLSSMPHVLIVVPDLEAGF